MVITLLSDFGDVYPASMKGVICCIDPGANIIDISHSIMRHDILQGAFILMACAQYFPSGSVHIAVIDPGVGTKRRNIAIKAVSSSGDVYYFIGPDNGLLIPAANSIGDMEIYELTNTSLFLEYPSSTFHGRDIFAPVGAYISKGFEIEKAGSQIFDYVHLDFGSVKKINGWICAKVVYVDSFGNIITNISKNMVNFQPGDEMYFQNTRIIFGSTYGCCSEGEPLLLVGSHGFLEVAVNRGNASAMFGKKQGDKLCFRI